MMRETEPFASMTPEARQALIRAQTVICAMSPTEALATLPELLPKAADRRRALAAVEGVAGPEAELGDAARRHAPAHPRDARRRQRHRPVRCRSTRRRSPTTDGRRLTAL